MTRTRESETYPDLDRLRDMALFVTSDSQVCRLLAFGAAAYGLGAIYILDPAGRADPTPGERFTAALKQWIPDANCRAIPLPGSAEEFDTLLDSAGGAAFVFETPTDDRVGQVIPALLARPNVDVFSVDIRPSGLRVADLRQTGAPAGTRRAAAADAGEIDMSLIAAGALLEEIRIGSGALAGGPGSCECRGEGVWGLDLPVASRGPGAPHLGLVGVGGIGSLLALFGLSRAFPVDTRLTLIDADIVAPENTCLSAWGIGRPKAEVVRDLMLRWTPLTVRSITSMVGGGAALPLDLDLVLAVTDSVATRLRVGDELRDRDRTPPIVAAGASVGDAAGAEAFISGGAARGACLACRYPAVSAAPIAPACSRTPSSVGANLVAAGLALAVARRAHMPECPIARITYGSDDPARFALCAPQSCNHVEREVP